MDEAKYKALTDGLEISEIKFSQLDLGDRYDSECFTKDYLNVEEKLNNIYTKKLGSLSTAVASAFYPAATQLYDIGDTAFVRCVDCIDYPIISTEQDPKFEKIPLDFAKSNKGISFVKADEIVITKVGTPCYASVVYDYNELALSRTVLGLTNIHDVDPYYLMAFLRSKYGFKQLFRQRELTIQYQLTLPRVKGVKIYIPSRDFQKTIKELCLCYLETNKQADNAYKQAENTLYEYLGCFADNGLNSCIVKTLFDSFIQSGRLDAEYYQSKYESLMAQINTTETVSSLCKLYDSNFVPYPDHEYRYIELSNVSVSGDITNIEKIMGNDLPSRARRMVKQGQVIVSSIEGSLSSCALIDSDYDGALCSTGFYVINSDKINSETLLVLFKSKPIQALLKQRCSGTILSAISKDEFLNIPLPNIDLQLQKVISDKVQESFSLRKEAKRRFDNAIKAVELAIETNEGTALMWLDSQL
ncbi:MAG: hypothetical protein J1F33_06830 [Clostridiales bacterium]|nr:hypothetical protein [Clostridiales bacterium]